MFQYLHQNDKPAYRACLRGARRRAANSVPSFWSEKSVAERHVWMHAELARKANDDAATEVLQTWLLGGHQQLICSFLDSSAVTHDGRGLLDTLPPEPQKERLQEAVDRLLDNHSRSAAIAYLHLFCKMDIADWPTLKEIIRRRFPPVPRTPTAAHLTPFQSSLDEALDTFETLRALEEDFARAVEIVHDCLRSGGKLLICGNGGSAADSAHIATEFTCRFKEDRRPYPAIALSADGGLLTAIGNDYGFQDIFSRQVWAFARPGDVLIALSTSGKSRNVLVRN